MKKRCENCRQFERWGPQQGLCRLLTIEVPAVHYCDSWQRLKPKDRQVKHGPPAEKA